MGTGILDAQRRRHFYWGMIMSWLVRMNIDSLLAYQKNLVDPYAWHKVLWQCFPNRSDKKRDFLTRVDETSRGFTAWILSPEKPCCPEWCPEDNFSINEITSSFFSHQFYAFDLRANPTRAVVQRETNGKPILNAKGKIQRGKRIPLVHNTDLRRWLERKASMGGFRIVDSVPLEIGPMVENYFSQKGNSAYHGSVQFRGVLEVTNRDTFQKTYQLGIGGAKGFGYGLLLLAPVSLN